MIQCTSAVHLVLLQRTVRGPSGPVQLRESAKVPQRWVSASTSMFLLGFLFGVFQPANIRGVRKFGHKQLKQCTKSRSEIITTSPAVKGDRAKL
jgi:hypothetical protein